MLRTAALAVALLAALPANAMRAADAPPGELEGSKTRVMGSEKSGAVRIGLRVTSSRSRHCEISAVRVRNAVGSCEWMTNDPVFGELESPNTLGPWAYANGNPMRFVDPMGLRGETLAEGVERIYLEELAAKKEARFSQLSWWQQALGGGRTREAEVIRLNVAARSAAIERAAEGEAVFGGPEDAYGKTGTRFIYGNEGNVVAELPTRPRYVTAGEAFRANEIAALQAGAFSPLAAVFGGIAMVATEDRAAQQSAAMFGGAVWEFAMVAGMTAGAMPRAPEMAWGAPLVQGGTDWYGNRLGAVGPPTPIAPSSSISYGAPLGTSSAGPPSGGRSFYPGSSAYRLALGRKKIDGNLQAGREFAKNVGAVFHEDWEAQGIISPGHQSWPSAFAEAARNVGAGRGEFVFDLSTVDVRGTLGSGMRATPKALETLNYTEWELLYLAEDPAALSRTEFWLNGRRLGPLTRSQLESF